MCFQLLTLARGRGSPGSSVLFLLKQWKTRKPKPSSYWFWKQVGWVLYCSYLKQLWSEPFRYPLPIFLSKQRKKSLLFMCESPFFTTFYRHVFLLGKWTRFMLQANNWFEDPDSTSVHVHYDTMIHQMDIGFQVQNCGNICKSSGIETGAGVPSRIENLTTRVCLYGLLRNHSEGSVLGTGRIRMGGRLVAHALQAQYVTPGSSAKDSLKAWAGHQLLLRSWTTSVVGTQGCHSH